MSGERIVATFGALAQADRLCGMFVSYDPDPEISRCSPGQLLILETIRDLSAQGVATFDLGVGEARYKDENCEAEEPLFDAAVAVTPIGLAFGSAALLRQRIKRWAKQTPWAWKVADGLRQGAYRLRGGAGLRQPRRLTTACDASAPRLRRPARPACDHWRGQSRGHRPAPRPSPPGHESAPRPAAQPAPPRSPYGHDPSPPAKVRIASRKRG